MKKPKVYITRKFFDEAINLINNIAEVKVFEKENTPIPRDILLEKIKNIDALLPVLTDKIDAKVMDNAKNLKVVSNYAVGYNNIDVKEATKRGIRVTNTPGVLTDSTADCAFALMMTISRRIVEVDKFIRNGCWKEAWGPKMLLGSDITGKTLGIIGLGRIGSAMVPRAKGFNMNVVYHNRNRDKNKENQLGVKYRDFDDLLNESDYVSLHVPLTKETTHLISKRELELMKSSAFLINTSRGPVIDEKALYLALKNNIIAGAALDVHDKEPIDMSNPLLKLKNIILTPHIGSATNETRLNMAMKAATNLVAVLNGEEPPDLVNPEVKKINPL